MLPLISEGTGVNTPCHMAANDRYIRVLIPTGAVKKIL